MGVCVRVCICVCWILCVCGYNLSFIVELEIIVISLFILQSIYTRYTHYIYTLQCYLPSHAISATFIPAVNGANMFIVEKWAQRRKRRGRRGEYKLEMNDPSAVLTTQIELQNAIQTLSQYGLKLSTKW